MRTSESLLKIQKRLDILHSQLKMASTTTVLVVGANRGLGLQFALQYLKKDFNVYGTYRKESASEAKEVCFQDTRVPICSWTHFSASYWILEPRLSSSTSATRIRFKLQPKTLAINLSIY
jgi:hypothetical protein